MILLPCPGTAPLTKKVCALPANDVTHRQCCQAQTSPTNGINARAYLSLKLNFAVLCRNTFMPSKPPGQPPTAPSHASVDSGTRRLEPPARHLSKPNVIKATTLNTANQIAANESKVLKRENRMGNHSLTFNKICAYREPKFRRWPCDRAPAPAGREPPGRPGCGRPPDCPGFWDDG